MSRPPYTAADCAEQTGYAIATDCINEIRNAPSITAGVAELKAALLDLQRVPHPKRACAGFAVAIVGFLIEDLQYLPKGGN